VVASSGIFAACAARLASRDDAHPADASAAKAARRKRRLSKGKSR
jgi:hypothetical protein